MSDAPFTGPAHPQSSPAIKVIALIGFFGACYWASEVLIPIIMSIFLFELLDPLVAWMEHKGNISRSIGAPVTVLLAVGIVTILVWGGWGIFNKLGKEIPQYSGKIRETLQSFEDKSELFQDGTKQLMPNNKIKKENIQKVEVVNNNGTNWTQLLLRGINSIFGFVTVVALIPILILFLLFDKAYLGHVLSHNLAGRVNVGFIAREMKMMVRGFFLGNFLVGCASSVSFFIFFKIIGLENSLVLAITAGIANLIPIFGPLVGALLPIAQAVLQFDTLVQALVIFVGSVFVHFLIFNFVMPKLIGSKINVNSTAGLFGLVFWGWLWGAMGLLLAIPLTATIRILLDSHASTKRWVPLITENTSRPKRKWHLSQGRLSMAMQRTTSLYKARQR